MVVQEASAQKMYSPLPKYASMYIRVSYIMYVIGTFNVLKVLKSL